jgi:importin-5
MKNRNFEDETRQSALEIVVTLSENMAGILRKNTDELKTQLFPALAYMMTEVDLADDLDAWLAEEELEVQAKQDPAGVAAESLQRISVFLGEKTTLACCSELIKAAIASAEWKENWMGYKALGMISEACKKSFKSNLANVA